MQRTAALLVLLLPPAIALAQYPSSPQYPPARTSSPAAPAAAAVSAPATAAPSDQLLRPIEQATLATLQDLGALRIDKWKTDGSSKDALQQQSAALQRNLAAALPELVKQVRAHPDDLAASFKLYRNLNALYDVLAPLAEAAGRVGPQGDSQSLVQDASAFDRARRAFADRLEVLATARDAEIARLRAQAPPPPKPAAPKKIIIDDTKPAAKSKGAAKKKTAATSPASSSTSPQ
ncbi:MAG TPA: hypothetical protein VEG08_03095 [Terriglobales bacterium]|nr:hypothetical protein [Terriglobales bacterium]